LCYTGEADGKYAGAMARWQDVGAFYTSLARWVSGQSGPLPDNMLVTQEVRKGVNLVQLQLDPERKRELVTSPPKVTVLRGRDGQTLKQTELAMRWTGPDTLAVEVPLHGSETALATVAIPGQDPVSLPPVCLPYSPEFQPPLGSEGTAALERLGRATGGKERVELAGIWKDLPKRPRLIAVGHWLLLAAVVLLLLEVLERRTGLLSRPRRLTRSAAAEAAAPPTPRRWFSRRRTPRPAPELPPLPPVTPAAAEQVPPAAPPPTVESGGMVDALRQARKRSRSRME
jgi:hypothetical protein